jgi:hypothetical protein
MPDRSPERSVDDLTRENLLLQNAKLEAEIRSFKRSPLLTNSPGLLVALAACIGILIQYSLMGVERKRAELDRQVANLEKMQLQEASKHENEKLAEVRKQLANLQAEREAAKAQVSKQQTILANMFQQADLVADIMLKGTSHPVSDDTLVWGIVVDSETHRPIAGAEITWWTALDLRDETPFTTDDNGLFVLPRDLTWEAPQMDVFKPGYSQQRVNLDTEQITARYESPDNPVVKRYVILSRS